LLFGFTGWDDPAIELKIQNSQAAKRIFRDGYKEKLCHPETLAGALSFLSKLFVHDRHVVYYLWLLSRESLINNKLQTRFNEVKEVLCVDESDDMYTFRHKDLAFFLEEICEMDDGVFAELIKHADVAPYANYLTNLRRWSGHLAPFKQTQKPRMCQEFDRRRSAVRYEAPDGSGTLKQQELIPLLLSPNRDIRYKALVSRFNGLRDSGLEAFSAESLDGIVKEWAAEAHTRGFERSISLRNCMNNVSDTAVDAMHEAVTTRGAELSQRYLRLKGRDMGLITESHNDFQPWDRLADINLGEAEPSFIFKEGRVTIIEAVSNFSSEMADHVRFMLDNNRVHAAIRDGKDPGAFCLPTTPEIGPYLSLNFTGNLYSVMDCLAHELGHGVHFKESGRAQSILTYEPTITTAECASIFCEVLTFFALLQKCSSPKERYAMRNAFLVRTINMIHRQTQFSLCEQGLDEIVKRDGVITAEAANTLYLDMTRKIYGNEGDVFASHLWLENEWSYIPHLHHFRFYVYAYAYAALLVHTLFSEYQKNPCPLFVEKYLNLLRAGGSMQDVELLKNLFNLDMTSPAFWSNGFNLTEQLIVDQEKDSALLWEQGLLPLAV